MSIFSSASTFRRSDSAGSSNTKLIALCLCIAAATILVLYSYGGGNESMGSAASDSRSSIGSSLFRRVHPECEKVEATGGVSLVTETAMKSFPGSHREIVHFEFQATDNVQGPRAVFDIVVPTVAREHGEGNADLIAGILSKGQPWDVSETRFVVSKMKECEAANHGKKENCHFLDVGANLGWYSMTIGSLGYSVTAFEANALLISALRTSITLPTNALYDSSKVSTMNLIPFGVGEEYRKCELQSPDNNFFGSASVKCEGEPEQPGYVRRGDVYVAPGDCFIEHLKNVAVMKIDVEGYEILAFKGLNHFMRNSPPKTIFAEFQGNHLRRHGFTGVSYISLLESMGYRCTLYGSENTLMMPIAVEDDAQGQNVDRNMVCVHQ